MFYALILNTDGNGIGSHAYVEQPSSYPSNEVSCTEAQAKNPMAYQVVNGQIVESLSHAKTSQIVLLQSAFEQAEQAPVILTLASGVTTSFGMSPHDWTKIVGLYSKYVVKGDPIPSNYPLPDVNMVLRIVTKADIDNLFEAGKTQIDNAVSKLASLLESVNTATTVEAVKLINW